MQETRYVGRGVGGVWWKCERKAGEYQPVEFAVNWACSNVYYELLIKIHVCWAGSLLLSDREYGLFEGEDRGEGVGILRLTFATISHAAIRERRICNRRRNGMKCDCELSNWAFRLK